MEFLDLSPMLGAVGKVRLPGSKSISNRVLLLAALAEGKTEIRDLLASDDVERMLEALQALGVCWTRTGESFDYVVEGVGGPFPAKTADLFLGNAGTAFRPLTAALALSGGDYRLSGVPRMHERPIGDLVEALRQLGADINCTLNEGFPPLHIKPARIRAGGVVQVRGDVSSQFLTALLMTLPLTGGGDDDRGRRRVDLQALYCDHARTDGALRCAGRAAGLGTLCGAGWRALSQPGYGVR